MTKKTACLMLLLIFGSLLVFSTSALAGGGRPGGGRPGGGGTPSGAPEPQMIYLMSMAGVGIAAYMAGKRSSKKKD